MNELPSTKRVGWVDICRFLSMVNVIMLHIGASPSVDAFVHLFHMPIFYVLSGYCFRFERHREFKGFLLSRLKGLIVPYVAFSVVFFLFWALVYGMVSPGDVVSFGDYLHCLLYENTAPLPHLWGAVQWFLTSLFWVEILFWACVRIADGKLTLLLVAVLTAFGFAFAANHTARLPLALDTSLVMLAFYALGYYLRRSGLLSTLSDSTTILEKLVLVGVLMWMATRLDVANGSTNVRRLVFGDSALYLIGATSGSLFIIVVSWIVDGAFQGFKIYQAMLYLGKNTIVLLYTHRLYNGLVDLFVLPHFHLSGDARLQFNYVLLAVFVVLFAYPSCLLVDKCFPWMIGKECPARGKSCQA